MGLVNKVKYKVSKVSAKTPAANIIVVYGETMKAFLL